MSFVGLSSVDSEFLLFLLLIFFFNMITLVGGKFKLVSLLSCGMAGVIVISGQVATEISANNILGMFGLLMVIFTFIIGLYNAATSF